VHGGGYAALLSHLQDNGRSALELRVSMCNYLHMLQDSRLIIKRLRAEGWQPVSSRGSHHKFRKNGLVLVVPHPKKDLPLGTARSIARAAGWLGD
jgi:predicted RNA binding protein YcfA (HicA-like mRNA interferase family)